MTHAEQTIAPDEARMNRIIDLEVDIAELKAARKEIPDASWQAEAYDEWIADNEKLLAKLIANHIAA